MKIDKKIIIICVLLGIALLLMKMSSSSFLKVVPKSRRATRSSMKRPSSKSPFTSQTEGAVFPGSGSSPSNSPFPGSTKFQTPYKGKSTLSSSSGEYSNVDGILNNRYSSSSSSDENYVCGNIELRVIPSGNLPGSTILLTDGEKEELLIRFIDNGPELI